MKTLNVFSELKIGDKLNNEQLCEVFKCGPQGGMRKSNRTNTLVLVSDRTQSTDRNPYSDMWVNEILHYTGMGLKGDQNINFMQNKTLANLHKNGVKAYLFEKHQQKSYLFKGEIVLASKIYYEQQRDSEGNERKVIKFPLKLV